MKNPWFRMYHEFAVDPKVQMLSEVDQRRFVMLLCLRCCNGDETLHDVAVAFQLRIPEEEYAKTKQNLMHSGLIGEDNKPVAWNKRQFTSDSSTARSREHRRRKKEEAERSCNVAVTPPDTDTDTDKRVSRNAVPEGFDDFWRVFPRKEGKEAARKAFRKLKPSPELRKTITDDIRTKLMRGTWKTAEKQFIPHPSTYLNGKRWEDEESGGGAEVEQYH